MTTTRLNQDPNKSGFFSVSVEIEISGDTNRDLVLSWFNQSRPGSATHVPAVHNMTFSPSSHPDLIDLQLTVEADSFKEARILPPRFSATSRVSSKRRRMILRSVSNLCHVLSHPPDAATFPTNGVGTAEVHQWCVGISSNA